jgi:hypothetical protein
VEFWDEYKLAKAINLELRSRIVLAEGEVLPVSIFYGAIEGLGADISKLHIRIMEERDEFRFRDLLQRAANLSANSARRNVHVLARVSTALVRPSSGMPVRR